MSVSQRGAGSLSRAAGVLGGDGVAGLGGGAVMGVLVCEGCLHTR